MMLVPDHRERQLLQYLRGRGWVNASLLPPSQKTFDGLLQKEWVERAGESVAVSYRITEKGMEAKTAPVRIY